MKEVRVRFAPSPTGFLHVGNVRTALFNWLLARHHGGTLILRIEDTDAERSKREFEAELVGDLRWLGLHWDEGVDRGGEFGPYRQSDRYPMYSESCRKLLAEDKAFLCFCTEQALEAVRQEQLARNEMPVYSGACRSLRKDEAESRQSRGEPAAVRLRVRPGRVGFLDLVYGRIEVDAAQISDPVILRSDGSPTYNFSCVVDDIRMQVSHVVRGEGHISNTHRQILIYEALGAAPPEFAHLSTVLGPDGQKLSKRHGTTSIQEFRSQGYLPDAIVSYLALLGWSPPEAGREILTRDEIVRLFDFSRVSKSPAIFDIAKLDWMNRGYINKTRPDLLAREAARFYAEAGFIPPQPSPEVLSWLAKVIDAVKTHVDHLDQLPRHSAIVFGFDASPPALDDDARSTLAQLQSLEVAREFARLVDACDVLTSETYRQIVGQVKSATGQKGKNLFHPIRAALTGLESGPELERLIPLYEEGSRLNLPRRVMSCRERLRAVLGSI